VSPSPAPGAAPPELPGYRYLQHIGTGGNAKVYLYEQDLPSRKVAVKVLNDSALSEAARRRFTAEANVTAVLAHRHIVQVFDAKVTDDGQPYIVMPFYPQPNLAVRARRAHFSVAEVLRIGIQIGSAVETSHRNGVLHRDIKPQNILTDAYGEPALTDFGIATTTAGDGPEGLSVPWSPPEILWGTGPGDQRSDVYSLGATLWHLLVGRPPFEQPGDGSSTSRLIDRINSEPPPRTQRADVPDSLERLLRRTLAKDPAARPESAMELIRGLQSIEQELRLPLTQPILAADEPVRGDTRGDTVARPALRLADRDEETTFRGTGLSGPPPAPGAPPAPGTASAADPAPAPSATSASGPPPVPQTASAAGLASAPRPGSAAGPAHPPATSPAPGRPPEAGPSLPAGPSPANARSAARPLSPPGVPSAASASSPAGALPSADVLSPADVPWPAGGSSPASATPSAGRLAGHDADLDTDPEEPGRPRTGGSSGGPPRAPAPPGQLIDSMPGPAADPGPGPAVAPGDTEDLTIARGVQPAAGWQQPAGPPRDTAPGRPAPRPGPWAVPETGSAGEDTAPHPASWAAPPTAPPTAPTAPPGGGPGEEDTATRARPRVRLDLQGGPAPWPEAGAPGPAQGMPAPASAPGQPVRPRQFPAGLAGAATTARPAGGQQAPAGHDQYVGGPDQYSAGPDRYAAGPDQYAAGPDQYAAGPDQYAAGPDQYAAGPDQYAAGPDRYAAAGPDQYAAGPDRYAAAGPDQQAAAGPEKPRSRRILAFAGGAGVLAVAAVVTVLALPHGSAAPSATATGGAQATEQGGQSALGPGAAAPGQPTVTARGAGAQQVEFSWTYANAASGDTFRWQEVSGGTGAPVGVVAQPELRLTVPKGRNACITVTVRSADGQASQASDPVCWPD
jgi:serine/threonine protein kinase